jgi:hypothetical protein
MYCNFGSFLKISNADNIFGPLLFCGRSYSLIWTKTRLGCILGAFFTNSFGHPACDWRKRTKGQYRDGRKKSFRKLFSKRAEHEQMRGTGLPDVHFSHQNPKFG